MGRSVGGKDGSKKIRKNRLQGLFFIIYLKEPGSVTYILASRQEVCPNFAMSKCFKNRVAEALANIVMLYVAKTTTSPIGGGSCRRGDPSPGCIS